MKSTTMDRGDYFRLKTGIKDRDSGLIKIKLNFIDGSHNNHRTLHVSEKKRDGSILILFGHRQQQKQTDKRISNTIRIYVRNLVHDQ